MQQTTTPTLSLHFAQHDDLSVPYPFHIEPSGDVARQDFWKGDPAALIGFQQDANRQTVDLLNRAWQGDPQEAVGMYPVFVTSEGQMFTWLEPVSAVS